MVGKTHRYSLQLAKYTQTVFGAFHKTQQCEENDPNETLELKSFSAMKLKIAKDWCAMLRNHMKADTSERQRETVVT
eukprot:2669620-Amphidinium_carterae.2